MAGAGLIGQEALATYLARLLEEVLSLARRLHRAAAAPVTHRERVTS
jgi:hypothetical protein